MLKINKRVFSYSLIEIVYSQLCTQTLKTDPYGYDLDIFITSLLVAITLLVYTCILIVVTLWPLSGHRRFSAVTRQPEHDKIATPTRSGCGFQAGREGRVQRVVLRGWRV